MDGIAPLLRFGREHPERVPPRDSGRELKIVLLDALARSLWQSLGRFEELDADHDLRVSADELRDAIRRSTHAPPVIPLVDGILLETPLMPTTTDTSRAKSPTRSERQRRCRRRRARREPEREQVRAR